MVECENCGAEVGDKDECPHCGVAIKHEPSIASRYRDRSTYEVRVDSDGTTRIHFGDGDKGRRPGSGKRVSSGSYRAGKGTKVCPHCNHEQRKGNVRCEKCGKLLARRRLH